MINGMNVRMSIGNENDEMSSDMRFNEVENALCMQTAVVEICNGAKHTKFNDFALQLH